MNVEDLRYTLSEIKKSFKPGVEIQTENIYKKYFEPNNVTLREFQEAMWILNKEGFFRGILTTHFSPGLDAITAFIFK